MVNGNCSQRQRLKYNKEKYKGFFSSHTYPPTCKTSYPKCPNRVNVSNPSTSPYFYFGKRAFFSCPQSYTKKRQKPTRVSWSPLLGCVLTEVAAETPGQW